MATTEELLTEIRDLLINIDKKQTDTLEVVDIDKNVMRVMNRRSKTDVELSETFEGNSATETIGLAEECIAVYIFVKTGVDLEATFTISGKTIPVSERDGEMFLILPVFTTIVINNVHLLDYKILVAR